MRCPSDNALFRTLSALLLGYTCLTACGGSGDAPESIALNNESLTQCENPENNAPVLVNRMAIEDELSRIPELAAAFGSTTVRTCGEALRYGKLFMDYEASRPGKPDDPPEDVVYPAEVTDKIHQGTYVEGAGANWQWQGIVLLKSGQKCTASFITGRHLLTAAHCFTNGPVNDGWTCGTTTCWANRTVAYSAPGLTEKTKSAVIAVQKTYTWGHRSDDLAIVGLATEETWANSSRRFRLYIGGTIIGTGLQIYGYGNNAYNATGGDVFRVGRDHTNIRLADHQDGYFKAWAHTARVCHGDSGGPAIKEGSMPIIWGTSTWFESAYNDNCPHTEEPMFWTKMTTNIGWIEGQLDAPCSPFTGDGQNYVRCW